MHAAASARTNLPQQVRLGVLTALLALALLAALIVGMAATAQRVGAADTVAVCYQDPGRGRVCTKVPAPRPQPTVITARTDGR